MSYLTNEQVLANWQECNRDNRPQGAEYWYDFMVKRARRGGKDSDKAKAVVDIMDKAK